uniref:Uncharacterized protein n=1 Tax=Macrostomum lignano TaxID=282301 RepID=A0A1I8G5E5_9PLAT
MLLLLQLQDC